MIRSLFVVKPSSLGDVVHTLPAVRFIKRAYPEISIRWVVNSEWAPLLHGNADLDGIIEFPRRKMRGLGALPAAFAFRRKLRAQDSERPRMVADFQGLLRSALIGRGLSGDRFLGLSDAREGAPKLYGETVDVDPDAHAVDRYLAIPRALGIECPDPTPDDFLLPANGVVPGSLPAGFIALHPYARGEGKALSRTHIERFCQAVAPVPVVVVGVASGGGLTLPGSCIDLTNRTDIAGLIAVLRAAKTIVSVDSGPMHIGAALTTDLIGIHTWTDPRKVGPYTRGCRVWKAGHIAGRDELSDTVCRTDAPVTDAAIDAIAEAVS